MYRIVVQLLEPYTGLSLCLVITVILLWRYQRPRSRMLAVATVLLVFMLVLSLPVTGFLALRSLESDFHPPDELPAMDDTLVVLSAGNIVDDAEGKTAHLDHTSIKRCLYAARLYKQAGGCQMILSGGKADWSIPGPTPAATMRDFLVEIGVCSEEIVMEDKSSTTYENAVYSKPLIEEHSGGRTWLVTDAAHMNRAERCFRKLGINVIPAPCDHHAAPWRFSIIAFLPSETGLSQTTRAAHEWQGRVWYKLRGRI